VITQDIILSTFFQFFLETGALFSSAIMCVHYVKETDDNKRKPLPLETSHLKHWNYPMPLAKE
jgi:hypothetical protein